MANLNPHEQAEFPGADNATFEQGAAVLLVMCHPVRLVILSLLVERELSIRHILEAVGEDDCDLFQHLTVLKKAGLITTRRGRETLYFCQNSKVLNILNILEDEFGYRRPAGSTAPSQH